MEREEEKGVNGEGRGGWVALGALPARVCVEGAMRGILIVLLLQNKH